MPYKTYYFNNLSVEIRNGVITKFSYFADNMSSVVEAPSLDHTIALLKKIVSSNPNATVNYSDQEIKFEGGGWKMVARTTNPPPPPRPPQGTLLDLEIDIPESLS